MRPFRLLFLLLPFIASLAPAGVVEQHGALRVTGGQVVGQHGPVSLAGNSLFWSQWEGDFWNADCVEWLAQDWKAQIVRAAVGVESGGYLDQPAVEMARVTKVIDAAIAEGIYVIVDWHDHKAENHAADAESFFRTIARKYGHQPHIIYEIYNEPLAVSWSKVIKPYAERIVSAIRAADPDNLILVGTPNWSQFVDEAADDPLQANNVAYTLHFYAGTHKQWLRDKADYALRKGVAIFVSEWGTCNADGDGPVDETSTREWLDFMRERKLSHCNWAVSDKKESASIVVPGSSVTGGWKDGDLTPSGRLVRKIIREWPTVARAK